MSERTVKIKNRSASQIIYTIPELGIRREFSPGETKIIAFDELEKLNWQAGGRELMMSFLQVTENKAIEDLNIPTEVEYHMSEEQIIDLLLKGDLDAYLDCLEFAPVGVIDLIKLYAVELPLTDTRKIEALKEKTGFDAAVAYKNKMADLAPEDAAPAAQEEEKKPAAQTNGRRRTNVSYEKKEETVAEEPAAKLPKYNVVSKQ
jgi:hypothetical protein